jgi:hypothetical protein
MTPWDSTLWKAFVAGFYYTFVTGGGGGGGRKIGQSNPTAFIDDLPVYNNESI